MMQQLAKLVRLRNISTAILPSKRPISSNKIDELLKSLSEKDRDHFKEKLMNMENDSRRQAMAGQTQETGYEAERIFQAMPKKRKPMPSLDELKRQGTQASRALRLELITHATSLGMGEQEARNVTERVTSRAIDLFNQKANQTVQKFAQEAEQEKAKEKDLDDKEKQVLDFASKYLEKRFGHKSRKGEQKKQFVVYDPVFADPNATKFFGNTSKALNLFEAKGTNPAPNSYWFSMEKRKTDITNLSSGPTNAFEEQILWTEQGKMWPYPINNEYLIGEEENISFTEHIFLDQYLAKKHTHLPKTGPIAHFMELVCVGLSKNPYMELSKKHMHLDSFAEFFNEEQIARVEKMHEVEKQAALG